MTLHGNTSKTKSLLLSLPLSSMLTLSFPYNLRRLFAIQFPNSVYFLSFCQTQKTDVYLIPLLKHTHTQTFLLPGARCIKITPCFSIKDNKMTISQTAPINNGDMVKTVV